MSGAHDLALFLHLLGVLGLVSGVVLAAVAHGRARRAVELGEIVALLRLARSGVLLAAPCALVLVAAGVWLADLDRLGWHTGWLRAAVGLFLLSAVLGAAGGRLPRRARELAEQLHASGGEPNEALDELLDGRPSRIANLASAAAMVGVLWLMVAKP